MWFVALALGGLAALATHAKNKKSDSARAKELDEARAEERTKVQEETAAAAKAAKEKRDRLELARLRKSDAVNREVLMRTAGK